MLGVKIVPEEHLCVSLVPLFNHLDLEDQKKVNALTHHRVLAKGEQAFSPEGEAQLVIVARGNLKVYQLSTSGKEQLLRIVEPGGYEGENQLFGAANTASFGEALVPSEVCVLRQADFTKLLEEYPKIALKLLKINAEKTLRMEQQAQFLVMEKVEERLAAYLLDLSVVAESPQITLSMKMKELAAFLGTTPETLSRKFKLLEDQSLIRRDKKQITVLDQEGLEDI